MLQILLYHLVRDVARAPCTVPDCPEVSSPVPLSQRRELLLEQPRGTSLESFYQLRERLRRRILNVHVDMIFAHDSLENPHVFSITDLHEQVATANLEVTLQNVVTVLRAPDDMCRQSRDGMSAMSILFHNHDF